MCCCCCYSRADLIASPSSLPPEQTRLLLLPPTTVQAGWGDVLLGLLAVRTGGGGGSTAVLSDLSPLGLQQLLAALHCIAQADASAVKVGCASSSALYFECWLSGPNWVAPRVCHVALYTVEDAVRQHSTVTTSSTVLQATRFASHWCKALLQHIVRCL